MTTIFKNFLDQELLRKVGRGNISALKDTITEMDDWIRHLNEDRDKTEKVPSSDESSSQDLKRAE
jgi:hypothetical protein